MVEVSEPKPLVECVPNFSEGRDYAVVREIVRAMQVPGVSLLDWSLDHDHNRSVVTIAGEPNAVLESAVRGAGRASQLIDLTAQRGVHPRIGAADVIPFVPVSGITLVQCAMLARQAGTELWHRYGVPAYFYEAAAARPDRALLEDVRRGQFEGLCEAVLREPHRRPDVGGPRLHPTAGASVIGARRFLVAYNIYLQSPDVSVARAIARELRASNGGMPGVKAMGVSVNGQAQLSMNITDLGQAPLPAVYERVRQLAARARVELGAGELIGLIPEDEYERESPWARQLDNFNPEEKIFENRLRHPMEWPA